MEFRKGEKKRHRNTNRNGMNDFDGALMLYGYEFKCVASIAYNMIDI